VKVYLRALLAFASASDAAAQQIVRDRPPRTLFAPLQAVDHVATIVRTPIAQNVDSQSYTSVAGL
jgi:hypothetical protein